MSLCGCKQALSLFRLSGDHLNMEVIGVDNQALQFGPIGVTFSSENPRYIPQGQVGGSIASNAEKLAKPFAL
jgi:hypothetical protein